MSSMSDLRYGEVESLVVDDQQSQLLNTYARRNVAAQNVADSISDHEKTTVWPGTPWPAKYPVSTTNQLSPPLDKAPTNTYVSWGVDRALLVTMILFFIFGVVTVVLHHYYYSRMDGTSAGDTVHQQLVIWIGTGFTFLTLFLLNSANGIAFTQHVWRLVRLHGFSIRDLDKLFSITLDIFAFGSCALWRRATWTMVLALPLWCMALTSVVPPGSIVVVPALQNLSQQLEILSFNWTNMAMGRVDCGILNCEVWGSITFSYPSPITVKLASQVAEGIAIMPIPPPVSNSSFSMDFFGPALSCGPATTSQQVSFDFYNEAAYHDSGARTGSQYLDGKYNGSDLLYYSAFSPQLYGSINIAAPVPGVPDTYNNWNASLPEPYCEQFNSSVAEIWIQLANESLVCSLYNASYNVGFDYPNGVQNITHRTVSLLNQWTNNISYLDGGTNYQGVLASLAPVLYGNVSVFQYPCQLSGGNTTCYMLSDTSSKILSSGVASCPELTHSFWQDHVPNGKSQSEQPDGSFGAFSSWECRNNSVALAIEDLMANYTISLLGTKLISWTPRSVTVDGMVYSSINVYSYDSKSLLASYSAAVGVSLILLIVGVFSFWQNGVGHGSSFAAFMTTTRNPELDLLTKGHSLGPLESLEQTVLKFGALAESSTYESTKRAAFGLGGSVTPLRKGQKYI